MQNQVVPKHPAEVIDYKLVAEIVAVLVLSLRAMRGGSLTDPDRLTDLVREALATSSPDDLHGIQNLTGRGLLGWLRHSDPDKQFSNAQLGAVIGASRYRLLALTAFAPDWCDVALREDGWA